MHGFEEPDDKRLYPIKTLEDMEANEAGNISDLLRNGNPALTSGSLLPSSKLRKSMRLFTPGSAGYLIDLSDVRVVRVDPWDLMSGINRFKKDLRFDQESIDELTNIPSLQELYRLYDAKTFKEAVAANQALSGQQLDILGTYYESGAHEVTAGNNEGDYLNWNEIIIAAKKEHIAAIFVPDYQKDPPLLKLTRQLQGALSGWEHADIAEKHNDKRMDLPVVYYHADPPNAGEFTYLAQGKDECEEVARDAIRKLQKMQNPTLEYALEQGVLGNVAIISRLKEDAERLLRIDITEPLKDSHRI